MAKFWVRVNGGSVKLTLGMGERLHWSQGRITEEGGIRKSESWEHQGDKIVRKWRYDGKDCDGRMIQSGAVYCLLDELEASGMDSIDVSISWPRWRVSERRQRDFQAEAAGY